MSEDLETRRKRLRYRSWHRGTKELDLLLGGFADATLGSLGAAQLDRYEALLEVPEAQIYAWLARRSAPPPAYDHDVMRMLLAHHYRSGRR